MGTAAAVVAAVSSTTTEIEAVCAWDISNELFVVNIEIKHSISGEDQELYYVLQAPVENSLLRHTFPI